MKYFLEWLRQTDEDKLFVVGFGFLITLALVLLATGITYHTYRNANFLTDCVEAGHKPLECKQALSNKDKDDE